MTDDQRKHLEFLQQIIARMNTNSFQVKAMAIAIVSALLAIFSSNQKVVFLVVGMAPLILFWCLDAFYLQQENKFRAVYNDIIGLTDTRTVAPFDMSVADYSSGACSYYTNFFSWTIFPIYFFTSCVFGSLSIVLLVNGLKLV